MENIFKNAKFGDKYKTRDGRQAIYLGYNIYGLKHWHQLALENTPDIDRNIRIKDYDHDGIFYSAYKGGQYADDIISKWDETENINDIDNKYLEIFSKLPHINSNYDIIDDWGYTPSLYHFDTQWFVSWVHCEDGDTLIDYSGNTPEEAIMNAYNNYENYIKFHKKLFD